MCVQLVQVIVLFVNDCFYRIDTGPSGPTRLYVGSLHYNTTEQELERIFSRYTSYFVLYLIFRYGSLDFVNMHTDNDTGRSKGYAFVQYARSFAIVSKCSRFKRADDAKRALSKAKGMELHGRPLKVGLVNESSQQGFLGELDDEGINNFLHYLVFNIWQILVLQ